MLNQVNYERSVELWSYLEKPGTTTNKIEVAEVTAVRVWIMDNK